VVASDGIDLAAAQRLVEIPDAEWRWLSPGFPSIDEPTADSPPAFASLLREFDAGLATSDRLTILVPDTVRGLDADRIALTHAFDWRVVPAATNVQATPPIAPRRVALRATEPTTEAVRYVRAALSAWWFAEPESWRIDDRAVGAGVDAEDEWLIWLGGEVPADVESGVDRGGRLLRVDAAAEAGEVAWRNEAGDVSVRERRRGKGRMISLLQPLDPAHFPELLDGRFPGHLRRWFEGTPMAPTIARSESVQPTSSVEAASPLRTSLRSLLAVLIAIVFLIERVMATRRRGTT
jgi:hypothetical protein